MRSLIEWFLRLIGLGHLVRLNRDVNRLVNTVERGNYAGASAQASAMTNAQGQGAYNQGGQAVPQIQAAVQANQNAWQPGQPMTAMQAGFVQSTMQNAMAQQQQNVNNAVAANPALTAPIEGVTIEQYAQVCAAAAANQNPGAFQQLLAQHGMDQAKYDRVAAGWQARMRDDHTFSLSTIYGRAFGGAGQGQFGGAGAAGAGALGQVSATGAGANVAGGEPVAGQVQRDRWRAARVGAVRQGRERDAQAAVRHHRCRLVEHEPVLDGAHDDRRAEDDGDEHAPRAVGRPLRGAQGRSGPEVLERWTSEGSRHSSSRSTPNATGTCGGFSNPPACALPAGPVWDQVLAHYGAKPDASLARLEEAQQAGAVARRHAQGSATRARCDARLGQDRGRSARAAGAMGRFRGRRHE